MQWKSNAFRFPEFTEASPLKRECMFANEEAWQSYVAVVSKNKNSKRRRSNVTPCQVLYSRTTTAQLQSGNKQNMRQTCLISAKRDWLSSNHKIRGAITACVQSFRCHFHTKNIACFPWSSFQCACIPNYYSVYNTNVIALDVACLNGIPSQTLRKNAMFQHGCCKILQRQIVTSQTREVQPKNVLRRPRAIVYAFLVYSQRCGAIFA